MADFYVRHPYWHRLNPVGDVPWQWLASRLFAQQKATLWLDRLGISPIGAARHCDDVLDRMHDPLDLVCQRLKGVAHLLDVLVFVIDAAHATDDVTETTLSEVGIDIAQRSLMQCP